MNPFFRKIYAYRKKVRNNLFHLTIRVLHGKKIERANTYFGKNFYFDLVATNYKIIFGRNVYFKRFSHISLRENALLEIGNNVFFNNYISINCQEKILIGDNCLFGEQVKLYDHNHRYENKNAPISSQGTTKGPIIIGNNCWIGSNVTILRNVTIGDNAIIGANCLIYKDVPANSVTKLNQTLHAGSY